MADIGSLVADLMVNDAQFNRGLTRAAQKTKSFSATTNRYLAKAQKKWDSITKSVFSYRGAMIAVASATALGYFIKKNLDAADTIGKTADKIGITTGKLQEYRFMANRAGVDTSQLDKGLEAFTKRIGELRVGTGALNTYLNKMDEEFKDQLISAKSTGEALDIYMNRMAGLTNASDKAALSAAAFSRSAGIAMVNVVRGGREEVEKLRKTFKDLGLEIDEALIRNAEKANDKLTNLSAVIKTQVTSAVVTLAPTIAEIAEDMAYWVKSNEEFLRQDIPEGIEKIGKAIDDIKPALSFFGEHWKMLTGAAIGAKIGGPLGALLGAGAGAWIEVIQQINELLDKSSDKIENFVRMKVPQLPTEAWIKGGGEITPPPIDPAILKEIPELSKGVEDAWTSINAKAAEYGELIKMDYEWAEEAWEREKQLLMEKEEFLESGRQAQWEAEWALQQDIQKGVSESYKKFKQIEAARTQMAKEAAMIMLANWNDAFAQLAKGSETAFALWKGTAMAQTIVDTYAAAQAAYKAMAGIPVVGPALGVAAAAGAIAAGMARVSAIQSQKATAMYHQGGVVGSGAPQYKMLPADTFSNAPRLHEGLRSDEYPAILQKGETVIPADDTFAEDDTPLLQVNLMIDGRELTKVMLRRTEIDSSMLNRLKKALA